MDTYQFKQFKLLLAFYTLILYSCLYASFQVSALDSGMESLGADTVRIDAHTEQQKAVNADVTEHKPQLDDVLVSGQNLLKHCSPEDANALQVCTSSIHS